MPSRRTLKLNPARDYGRVYGVIQIPITNRQHGFRRSKKKKMKE